MKNSEIILIAPENKGVRLDKFLADFDVSASRAAWQKRIKNGQVLVNEKVSFANYSLKEKDEIRIIEENHNKIKQEKNIPDIKILYEDNDIIVIDKPIGVIAQRTETSDTPAVTDFLENHFPSIKKIGESEQKSGLVHRLDKDTSGIMIAAKNQETFEFLKAQFKERKVRKIYTALVYGKIKPEEGEINIAIGRNPKLPCKQTVVRNPEKSTIKAREAKTLYRTVKTNDNYSLLSVELKTGRMHQIRVHMQAIGHPIVGDRKYASPGLLKNTKLQRQFLHASELKINLPGGKEKSFKSELPEDLKDSLKKLNDLD